MISLSVEFLELKDWFLGSDTDCDEDVFRGRSRPVFEFIFL